MVRSELSDRIAVQKGISRDQAERTVTTLFNLITQALKDGERVTISGFGTFSVKEHDAYIGKNPKTGVPVVVGPKKAPYFKVSTGLKVRIQENRNPVAGGYPCRCQSSTDTKTGI